MLLPAPSLYYSARVCLFSPPWKQHKTTCCTRNPMPRGFPLRSVLEAVTSKPWHRWRVHQRRKGAKKARTIDRVICAPEEFPVSLLVVGREPTGSARCVGEVDFWLTRNSLPAGLRWISGRIDWFGECIVGIRSRTWRTNELTSWNSYLHVRRLFLIKGKVLTWNKKKIEDYHHVYKLAKEMWGIIIKNNLYNNY